MFTNEISLVTTFFGRNFELLLGYWNYANANKDAAWLNYEECCSVVFFSSSENYLRCQQILTFSQVSTMSFLFTGVLPFSRLWEIPVISPGPQRNQIKSTLTSLFV